MRARQFLVAAAAAALLVPLAATAQAATPPGNDTVAGATGVGALPQTITESTLDATTDAVDAALNATCGAPATNGSVWFTYTDTTGDGLVVDVSRSDFSAGVMIVDGDPTAGGELVSCGPGLAAARGGAGVTYYVMAFSDTPGVTGGNLSATFEVPPPAPTAALTVSPNANAYKDGTLKVTGTYSCTNADYESEINGTVVQVVGRMKITGYYSVFGLECDGELHPWEAYVTSDTGLFGGGKATTASAAFVCGVLDCDGSFVEQNLKISRNGK